MILERVSIKAKLAAAFGGAIAIVMIVSGVAMSSLRDANQHFAEYLTGINARAEMAQNVRVAVEQRAIAMRNMLLFTKDSELAEQKDAELQDQRDVESDMKRLDELMVSATDSSEKEKNLVQEINRIESLYSPVAKEVVELAQSNRAAEAIAKLDTEARPLLASLNKATRAYAEHAHEQSAELIRENAERDSRQRELLIAICLGAVGISILFGMWIARGLTRALGAEPGDLKEITGRITGGDLGSVPGAVGAPEGSVLASMGEMQSGLVKLITQVRTAADSIATGASQIATGNVDLSSRTEQQAASLQETASSMEELTSIVKQNAEGADQASSFASDASSVAQKASTVVVQVVDTMTDISGRSKKIAEIIGIIEGIAFQTNILALNAAVEAARAGEQGRGFAVVASEVRGLAQRSSSAAKEIKELISSSVEIIHTGSLLAEEAGNTMLQVTQAVVRVTDIIEEIAAASAEQSRGIEEVNRAITQMDEVTQQNAALVEEAAAASKSLEEQGVRLVEAISIFSVDHVGQRQ